MKITVKVKPNSRENSVTRLGDNNFMVKVTAPPEKGRANEKVIELIAKHLKIRKSAVTIMSGHTSGIKILSVSQ